MGLDKELMACITDRENIKRNIRKSRQKESNDPKNPQCRATFEIAVDNKSIKRPKLAMKSMLVLLFMTVHSMKMVK